MKNFFKRLFRMRGSIPVEKFTILPFTSDDISSLKVYRSGIVWYPDNDLNSQIRVGKLEGVVR